MKNDDLAYIRPRAMGKGELALLYAPEQTQAVAVKRLVKWMRLHPLLMDEINATGYRTHQKQLSARQVEIIFKYLGNP